MCTRSWSSSSLEERYNQLKKQPGGCDLSLEKFVRTQTDSLLVWSEFDNIRQSERQGWIICDEWIALLKCYWNGASDNAKANAIHKTKLIPLKLSLLTPYQRCAFLAVFSLLYYRRPRVSLTNMELGNVVHFVKKHQFGNTPPLTREWCDMVEALAGLFKLAKLEQQNQANRLFQQPMRLGMVLRDGGEWRVQCPEFKHPEETDLPYDCWAVLGRTEFLLGQKLDKHLKSVEAQVAPAAKKEIIGFDRLVQGTLKVDTGANVDASDRVEKIRLRKNMQVKVNCRPGQPPKKGVITNMKYTPKGPETAAHKEKALKKRQKEALKAFQDEWTKKHNTLDANLKKAKKTWHELEARNEGSSRRAAAQRSALSEEIPNQVGESGDGAPQWPQFILDQITEFEQATLSHQQQLQQMLTTQKRELDLAVAATAQESTQKWCQVEFADGDQLGVRCDQVSCNWKKYRYRDPVEEIFTQTFTTLGRGQTLPFEIPVVFEYDVVQPVFMKMLDSVQVYSLYMAGASQGEESRKIVLAPITVVTECLVPESQMTAEMKIPANMGPSGKYEVTAVYKVHTKIPHFVNNDGPAVKVAEEDGDEPANGVERDESRHRDGDDDDRVGDDGDGGAVDEDEQEGDAAAPQRRTDTNYTNGALLPPRGTAHRDYEYAIWDEGLTSLPLLTRLDSPLRDFRVANTLLNQGCQKHPNNSPRTPGPGAPSGDEGAQEQARAAGVAPNILFPGQDQGGEAAVDAGGEGGEVDELGGDAPEDADEPMPQAENGDDLAAGAGPAAGTGNVNSSSGQGGVLVPGGDVDNDMLGGAAGSGSAAPSTGQAQGGGRPIVVPQWATAAFAKYLSGQGGLHAPTGFVLPHFHPDDPNHPHRPDPPTSFSSADPLAGRTVLPRHLRVEDCAPPPPAALSGNVDSSGQVDPHGDLEELFKDDQSQLGEGLAPGADESQLGGGASQSQFSVDASASARAPVQKKIAPVFGLAARTRAGALLGAPSSSPVPGKENMNPNALSSMNIAGQSTANKGSAAFVKQSVGAATSTGVAASHRALSPDLHLDESLQAAGRRSSARPPPTHEDIEEEKLAAINENRERHYIRAAQAGMTTGAAPAAGQEAQAAAGAAFPGTTAAGAGAGPYPFDGPFFTNSTHNKKLPVSGPASSAAGPPAVHVHGAAAHKRREEDLQQELRLRMAMEHEDLQAEAAAAASSSAASKIPSKTKSTSSKAKSTTVDLGLDHPDDILSGDADEGMKRNPLLDDSDEDGAVVTARSTDGPGQMMPFHVKQIQAQGQTKPSKCREGYIGMQKFQAGYIGMQKDNKNNPLPQGNVFRTGDGPAYVSMFPDLEYEKMARQDEILNNRAAEASSATAKAKAVKAAKAKGQASSSSRTSSKVSFAADANHLGEIFNHDESFFDEETGKEYIWVVNSTGQRIRKHYMKEVHEEKWPTQSSNGGLAAEDDAHNEALRAAASSGAGLNTATSVHAGGTQSEAGEEVPASGNSTSSKAAPPMKRGRGKTPAGAGNTKMAKMAKRK
eukprot:g12781.t1